MRVRDKNKTGRAGKVGTEGTALNGKDVGPELCTRVAKQQSANW
jgi:hypothetical protein